MSDNYVDFLETLAHQPLDSFVERPNLPGSRSFFGQITSLEAARWPNEKQTPFIRIRAKLTGPGNDVQLSEMEMLSAAGYNLSDYEVYRDFFLTPSSMWRFQKFVASLDLLRPGVDMFTLLKFQNNMPTAETQELVRGKKILCVTQAATSDGRVYPSLESMIGVN